MNKYELKDAIEASASLEVNEIVIMRSPYTGENVEMNFRGDLSDGMAVVYNPRSGMQLTVPIIWLRKR